MRRKTILYLVETGEPGGAERVIANMISSINTEHYRVILGCSGDPSWLLSKVKECRVEVKHFKRNKVYDLKFLFDIWKTIRRENIDIIHSHMFTMNFYGTVAGTMARRPVIVTIHDRVYDLRTAKRVRAYRIIGCLASRTVAVSEEIKEVLINKVGLSSRKVTLVQNGVNLDHYSDPKSAFTEVKEVLGVPPTSPVVGIIGLFHPVKGHSFFLKAAFQIIREVPTTYFVMVGDGPLRQNLEALAQSLGIRGKVIFTGFRDEIPEILTAIDVCVVPSLSEGLSMALLESMAAGRPIVATRVGGNCEAIRDGKDGILIPPSDHIALAKSVVTLLRNKSLCNQLGQSARTTASERFSLKQMVESYETIYEEARDFLPKHSESPRGKPGKLSKTS